MQKHWRWFILAGILLVLIATGLWWAPPLLEFTSANSDLIQGLEALLAMVLGLGSLVIGWLGYRRERAEPPNRSITTDGAAYVEGSINTSGGPVIGRDQVIIFSDRLLRSFRPRFTGDLQAAMRRYMEFLYDQHCYLSLKGLGVSDRVALRLPLLEVYIPLRARLELPVGETWQAEIRVAGRRLADDQEKQMRLSEPQPVLDILRERAGLILLGDPGAGKSTFLKFLALKMALGQGGELGLGDRLPVLVPLAAYANVLDQEEILLDEFISDYFFRTCGDLPVGDLLRDALDAGRALVLLDGLDEVKNLSLRATVVQRAVNFFNFHRRSGNKFVLTSRIVGYREVRQAAEDLVEGTLVDFDEEEIDAFVDCWTAALERQAQGEESTFAHQEAEREKNDLQAAIRHNAGVRRLAANPLLLTILAVMKRQGVTLPDRRVELYDQYVRTMLSVWNRARSLTGRATGLDLDVAQTVRILAPLALWMHETNPGVGLVKREDLRRKLAEIFIQRGETGAEEAASRFLDDIHEHTGLLLERGPGEYGFIHLTFEEYLAGVAIALRGQGKPDALLDSILPLVVQPAWREVLLLSISYLALVQQLDGVASAVIEQLSERLEEAERVILAGEAAVDLKSVGLAAGLPDKLQHSLLLMMRGSGGAAAPLRVRAGNMLSRLGDPRFRADVWYLPDEPLLGFVEIPAGPFVLGSDPKKDPHADKDEQPQHMAHLPTFWIARYPVTVAQYQAFEEDRGYQSSGPVRYRGPANNPVTDVSWHDAIAYCGWLTEKLCRWSKTPEPLRGILANGGSVILPSEAEWEKAARGTDSRIYPWGSKFDPEKAHTGETGIYGTSTVGCFSGGTSPYGIEELSGNVWEWTRSVLQKYPYDPHDGREDLQKDDRRVLRGGSWGDIGRFARCAVRNWFDPDDWFAGFGFRVVVLPSSTLNSENSDTLNL